MFVEKPIYIEYNISNINVNYIDIDLKSKKLLVLSLVNNCEQSLPYINYFLDSLDKIFLTVKSFFFSNNNNNIRSEKLLKLYCNGYKNRKCFFYQNEKINIQTKINSLSKYRNLNFIHAIKNYGNDFDYVLIFDSDIKTLIPINAIQKSLCIDYNWSCISGNSTYKYSNYYYDELALRIKNDPIDISLIHNNFNLFYGKNHKWIKYFRIINNWLEVDSAFGSISIYKMNELLDIYKKHGYLYNTYNFPPYTCEHVSLNQKLKNSILISPLIKFNHEAILEGPIYKTTHRQYYNSFLN